MCVGCLFFCLTCTNTSQCATCDAVSRNITDLTRCPCRAGYYQDSSSVSCPSCHPSCLTCTNPNNCSSCPLNRTFTDQHRCQCTQGTYEPDCYPCLYSCLACTQNNTCSSCNSTAFRQLSSNLTSCICAQGYFDNGANQLCIKCQYSCLSCNGALSCLNCPFNRQLNGSFCACLPGSY